MSTQESFPSQPAYAGSYCFTSSFLTWSPPPGGAPANSSPRVHERADLPRVAVSRRQRLPRDTPY